MPPFNPGVRNPVRSTVLESAGITVLDGIPVVNSARTTLEDQHAFAFPSELAEMPNRECQRPAASYRTTAVAIFIAPRGSRDLFVR